jgi:protein FAM32A
MADRDGSGDEREDEPFVVSGQLKLKGGLKLTRKKKHKSKKKSKKHKKDKADGKRSRDSNGKKDDNDDDDDAEGEEVDEKGFSKRARVEGGDGDDDGADGYSDDADDGLTPAQREFERIRLARESKTLEKIVSKSYRERVDEFNEYLGSLSEHHAVANVGNAGMG